MFYSPKRLSCVGGVSDTPYLCPLKCVVFALLIIVTEAPWDCTQDIPYTSKGVRLRVREVCECKCVCAYVHAHLYAHVSYVNVYPYLILRDASYFIRALSLPPLCYYLLPTASALPYSDLCCVLSSCAALRTTVPYRTVLSIIRYSNTYAPDRHPVPPAR